MQSSLSSFRRPPDETRRPYTTLSCIDFLIVSNKHTLCDLPPDLDKLVNQAIRIDTREHRADQHPPRRPVSPTTVPSQSSDLNLWAELNRTVGGPRTLDDLERLCKEEWSQIPFSVFYNLIRCYGRRLCAISHISHIT